MAIKIKVPRRPNKGEKLAIKVKKKNTTPATKKVVTPKKSNDKRREDELKKRMDSKGRVRTGNKAKTIKKRMA